MLNAYEVKTAGKHNPHNNDTEYPGRKVPRLAFSKDVKTPLRSNQNPNKISLVLPSDQTSQLPSRPEIKNLYLSPYSQESRMSGWSQYYPRDVELPEYQHGENPHVFDSAYPYLVPAAYRCSNVTAMPVESISRGHPPRRFLVNVQNHSRTNRQRYPRLRPSPFYPPALQSTAPALKPINSSPSPTQPSPSLPLHQPRPSKRIPIISLSRLALACEDLEATQTISHWSRNEITSSSCDVSDVGAPRDLDHHQFHEKWTAAELRDADRPMHAVRCSCGCMKSYAIG